jgi:nitrous oxidase accessory protein NosD
MRNILLSTVPYTDNFGDSINVVIYFKRDDFNFDIVNFPHLSSNIPSSPVYVVYIFQSTFPQVLHSSIVHSFARQHKFHPSKQKGVGQKLIESILNKF